MGYFGGAFVFTQEPSWGRMRQFMPELNFRGYKHKDKNIWLLDFWEGENESHEYPFVDAYESDTLEKLPENETSKSFSEIKGNLDEYCDANYGSGWHKLTVAVAKVLILPTYFFAADDEFYDFACSVSPLGSTDMIACRFDPRCSDDGKAMSNTLHVKFAGNGWTVTPLTYDDLPGEESTSSEAVLAKLRAVPHVTVSAPCEDERIFYENPVKEWPSGAGSPEEILGIGTWDPYLNIDSDFSVVFERVPGKTAK
jgi:hypothetical protein